MHPRLADFVNACRDLAARCAEPSDCVLEAAPLMHRLLESAEEFLTSAHLRPDANAYARNAIHLPPDGRLSLYALVWSPGQWTPVHDHGSWGVVGVVRGVLEERSFLSPAGAITGDHGIRLERGGIVLLGPGSVSTFVPNPDHIHMTGVPETRETAVSLHLYGRTMNAFHVYDLAAGTRRLIDVPHQES
jgi:predicted metal-dependent enzyme (double-stranded beta helix superfamily)